MTDNKLLSALIYRLDQDGSTVCVAKYDYAGQYEQNGGLDIESGVFNNRNQSYADAVAAVIYNDKPRGLQQPQELGGFKFVQSEQHQITYGADVDGLCCAVITGPQYPSRVAITMLQDLYTEFTNQYGEAAKTAHENALSRKAKTILKNICQQYDDPASVDQTQRVLQQVDAVKGQMHANIATMKQNTETAESMTLKSEQLDKQARGLHDRGQHDPASTDQLVGSIRASVPIHPHTRNFYPTGGGVDLPTRIPFLVPDETKHDYDEHECHTQQQGSSNNSNTYDYYYYDYVGISSGECGLCRVYYHHLEYRTTPGVCPRVYYFPRTVIGHHDDSYEEE